MNRRNYDMAERFEIVEKALLQLLEEKSMLLSGISSRP